MRKILSTILLTAVLVSLFWWVTYRRGGCVIDGTPRPCWECGTCTAKPAAPKP